MLIHFFFLEVSLISKLSFLDCGITGRNSEENYNRINELKTMLLLQFMATSVKLADTSHFLAKYFQIHESMFLSKYLHANFCL